MIPAKHFPRLSSRSVLFASIAADFLIGLTKFAAAFFTRSSAMLSEGIHSIVDTGNGILVLYGLRRAAVHPDHEHPFGHGRENDGARLYFYRARYYSPAFQRFIAQDPVGFRGGQADIYAYLYDDPIDMLDPYGFGFLGKLWNGINDIPGALWGGAGALAGAFSGATISVGHNAIQIENDPLMPEGSAITLGNVICYGRKTPDGYGGPDQLGQHEMQHTIQGEGLGPLYLPANGVGGAISESTTGDWHANNLMEQGPMSDPPRPWK